jgi:hypothetical protein
MIHKNLQTLIDGSEYIKEAPSNQGVLQLIVARPAEDQRKELEQATLDIDQGLVGDNWRNRSSSRTADGSAHPDMQITLMNSRVIELICQQKSDWQMAGDQLYADIDVSQENMPPGTKLAIGESELEVTDQPHTGCKKFSTRFGIDALKFISDKEGKSRQMRGIYLKVIKNGVIKTGDLVTKV